MTDSKIRQIFWCCQHRTALTAVTKDNKLIETKSQRGEGGFVRWRGPASDRRIDMAGTLNDHNEGKSYRRDIAILM